MKMNYDCHRDLLLFLETNITLKNSGRPEPVKAYHIESNEISGTEDNIYSDDDIYYALQKLHEAKYIKVMDKSAAPKRWIIEGVTSAGHEYLASIKDPKVWEVVKEKLNFVPEITYAIIKATAVEVGKSLFGTFVGM